MVYLSETWADDNKLDNDSLIRLPGYNVLHQIRKNSRSGGISIFVHESLSFKRRQYLGISLEAMESLSISILSKKCKNIILNTIYRPSNGDIKICENHFKNDTLNKHIVLAGDFNLNVLDFESNKKIENFINPMFCYGMIPNINKSTRVTANTATAIDHIVTNVTIETDFKAGILKSCISDHFAIMLAFRTSEKKICNKSEQHIHKQIFKETSIESFRLRLREIRWDHLKTSNDSNLAYNEFLNTFTSL